MPTHPSILNAILQSPSNTDHLAHQLCSLVYQVAPYDTHHRMIRPFSLHEHTATRLSHSAPLLSRQSLLKTTEIPVRQCSKHPRLHARHLTPAFYYGFWCGAKPLVLMHMNGACTRERPPRDDREWSSLRLPAGNFLSETERGRMLK